MTASTDDVQYLDVPLVFLRESPTNPRRTMADAGLQDLAQSIKEHGLLQPILVRPIEPQTEDEPAYEIVFGHRRYRAARLAELEAVPCMSQPLTDAEVRVKQLVENLQREDVSALEEAEGYRDLLAAEGISAEQLAERIGKSRTYVYGRLKLNSLSEAARASVIAGKLQPEVAQLLARYGDHRRQDAVLGALDGRLNYDGEPKSYREAREYLTQFNFDLAKNLPQEFLDFATAEQPICRTCPHLTVNDPGGAEIYGSVSICLDPDCRNAKLVEWRKVETAALLARGAKKETESRWSIERRVLDGEAIDLNKIDKAIDKTRPLIDVLGDKLKGAKIAAAGTQARGTEKPLVVMSPSALQKALKAAGIDKAPTLPKNAARQESREPRQAENIRNRDLWDEFARRVVHDLVINMRSAALTHDDLLDITAYALAENTASAVAFKIEGFPAVSGWAEDDIRAKLADITPEDLPRYVLAFIVNSALEVPAWNRLDKDSRPLDDFREKQQFALRILARYSVDIDAIASEVYAPEPAPEAEATDQPKAKAKKAKSSKTKAAAAPPIPTEPELAGATAGDDGTPTP